MEISSLKIENLLRLQNKLDKLINKKSKNYLNIDLLNAKILGFIVEIAEFSNENRCFKYWSNRSSSSKQVLLEEYVDALHFLLSINNQCNFSIDSSLEVIKPKLYDKNKYIATTLKIIELAIKFQKKATLINYQNLFYTFLHWGKMFKFTAVEIYHAYLKKCAINTQRQLSDY